jgi:hypothetical protein
MLETKMECKKYFKIETTVKSIFSNKYFCFFCEF